MNTEVIEHLLVDLNGKEVSIVRPFKGTQSDSFGGDLVAYQEQYPVAFEFQSPFIAIKFTAGDVKEVVTRQNRNIIYLKGLDDYVSREYLTVL